MKGWPWNELDPLTGLVENRSEEGWPRITVVTPSYNQVSYLEATIRSVLSQRYANLEYFVLDGASTDGSVDVIRQYAPWIDWWVSERDEGQAAAINRGFERATGDILAWLNSDDLYCPGALWAVAAAFRNQPAAQLVYGEGWYIDERGERIQPSRYVRQNFTPTYIANRDPIFQPASFWTSNLWREVGPLNTRLHWAFDWEWFIRAYQRTTFHYLPRDLAYYRVQPETKTLTGGLERQLEHGRLTRRYGAWWHPNHLVQQARRFAFAGAQASRRWPGWLVRPVRTATAMPAFVVEHLFKGRYMD
jgi:glycosyltransferase involved in cell wall biosynthesis